MGQIWVGDRAGLGSVTHVVVGHVRLFRELYLLLAIAYAAHVASGVAERPAEHAAHARIDVRHEHPLALQGERRGLGVVFAGRRRARLVHRRIHRRRLILGHINRE